MHCFSHRRETSDRRKTNRERGDFHFVQDRSADISHASFCTSIPRFLKRWFSLSRVRYFTFFFFFSFISIECLDRIDRLIIHSLNSNWSLVSVWTSDKGRLMRCLQLFNLLRWNDVPRTSRIFCPKIAIFSVLSIFKYNLKGKPNNKFITSW